MRPLRTAERGIRAEARVRAGFPCRGGSWIGSQNGDRGQERVAAAAERRVRAGRSSRRHRTTQVAAALAYPTRPQMPAISDSGRGVRALILGRDREAHAQPARLALQAVTRAHAGALQRATDRGALTGQRLVGRSG